MVLSRPQRPRECPPPARALEQMFQSGQEHALLCAYMVLEHSLRHNLCDMAADPCSPMRARFVTRCYEHLRGLTQEELKEFNENGPWSSAISLYKAEAIERSKSEKGMAKPKPVPVPAPLTSTASTSTTPHFWCQKLLSKRFPKPSLAPCRFRHPCPRSRRSHRGNRNRRR